MKKELQVEGEYLVDCDGNVWDWRDPKKNWSNRAILDTAYANFIITQCEHYWRPAFNYFNCLIYQDFIRRIKLTQQEKYFLRIKNSLIKFFDEFFEHLNVNNPILYNLLIKLKSQSDLSVGSMQVILSSMLGDDFNLMYISKFYFDLTCAPYGLDKMKEILPILSDSLVITETQLNQWYEQAQPAKLFGAVAIGLRGRIQNEETNILDRCGRRAFVSYDGYSIVDAPRRVLSHYSASRLFKILPETESIYVASMRSNGMNVNAGPSGTLGRINFLLAIFRYDELLTEDESRRIILALTADFVKRGHHTFIECMQACQAKPMQDDTSSFGLFKTPLHLLVRDPRIIYEEYFLSDLLENKRIDKQYEKFRNACDDLVRPIPQTRFGTKQMPAI